MFSSTKASRQGSRSSRVGTSQEHAQSAPRKFAKLETNSAVRATRKRKIFSTIGDIGSSGLTIYGATAHDLEEAENPDDATIPIDSDS